MFKKYHTTFNKQKKGDSVLNTKVMKQLFTILIITSFISCKKDVIYVYYPTVVQQSTPIAPTSNLILNLDATSSISNRGGNIWYDLSDYKNNATLNNGAKFIGGSVNFDGYDDVALLGQIRNYDNLITIEAWVRTTDVDMQSRSILTANGSGDFVFYSTGDTKKRITNFGTFNDAPFKSSCFGSIDLTKNGWTHYVVTYSNIASIVKIYIDGKIDKMYIRNGKLNPGYLSIGNLASRLDEGWLGDISIIRVYKEVLNDYQIMGSYLNDKSKFGK